MSAAVTIRYGGPLLGYSEAMGYVKDHIDKDMTLIRSDSLAIPEIGVPSWRTNRSRGLKSFGYKVSVTVPAGLVVANGGNLVSKNETNGKTTYVYTSKVPSWRMDFALSKYEIRESEDKRFRIFSFPADGEGARDLLSRLTEALGLFTQWFGPLKSLQGLTVIEIPDGYGSQADAAAIIQEARAVRDRTNRSDFYHELSHLWNVEAKDPLPCRFESEGLATFLQRLVEEKLEGKAGAVETAVDRTLTRMREDFAKHPDWKSAPMIDYGEKDLTDLSYRVGQIAFYLLYQSLGEKAFLETIGGFTQDFSGRGATTRQFVEYVKRRSSVSLDRLFDEWVFTPKAAYLIMSGLSLAKIAERYR
jgi:aminopeptidase N